MALKLNTVFRIGLAYFNKFDNNSFIIALAFPILAIGPILPMAKIGNASAIMKELLSNLLKYANQILNAVLSFKATGSRLCMWLWTLSNDSVYSSLFVNQTSHHSHAHITSDITSFTCSHHISMLLAADVRGCVLVSCQAV